MPDGPERPGDRIALYTHIRYASPRAPVLIESRALRRPELLVRRTRYLGVVVDERVFARTYAIVPRPGRMQAFMPLDGRIFYGARQPLAIGTVLLLHRHHQPLLRFENADFLEIAWDTEQHVETPIPLGIHVETDAMVTSFEDPRASQRQQLRIFFDSFRRAGVTLPAFEVDRMKDSTTEHDVRLAAALRHQLQTIRGADTLVLGELAGLSPRQLQRLYAQFCLKYDFALSSWRDTRNRWRIQLAALLLSRPELTLAMVADEVGYSSSPALGRAFVQVGFPPPAELRQQILQPEADVASAVEG